jgi:hypothetical protein
MLVYHPKSVRHLLPVREELIRAGHAVDFYSPRPEVEATIRRANCTAYSLAGGLAPRPLARDVYQFINEMRLNLTTKTRNDHILAGAFRLALQRLAFVELILYSRCAGPLGKALGSGIYQLAVGTDSGSTAGRCFFMTAERLGIKTAFLQHGSFSVGPDVAPYFTQSQIYTWGETSRQQLIDSNVSDPERIVAIGSSFEEDHLQASTGPPAGARPLILVTFGVPGNLVPERPFLAACREVMAAAALHRDCDFVVKLHPGDRTTVWQSALQECSSDNLELSQIDTYTLLGQCSVLITMFSTTGAEAICLGKPVISVNLENFPATNDYLRAGAAYEAKAAGSVHAILAELFSAPSGHDRLASIRADFAQMLLHREATPAGKRIASALENLVLERAEGRTPC